MLALLKNQLNITDIKKFATKQAGIPLFLLTLLAMMILPLPPVLLDVFFSTNIALSLIILLVAVYALSPLQFAVFPTILLIATLLRLALNVASTRVVLLYGHAGGDAAGKVIESFGEVVIGGNYAVGLVVFLILVIINFIVITKGAGRISEVSARFTLDAMPGKQMAIDADLNAGLIDKDEAKKRREEIASEADFYGAMDGASKFVRGDAVAGILILLINILGGLAIGMIQHSLSFSLAMERYALLTIGDGLVAQIPSLLLSTAAAIMVTRVSHGEQTMSEQVVDQMFGAPQAMMVASVILFIMGIVPGMPHVAFIGLSLVCVGIALMIKGRAEQGAGSDAGETAMANMGQDGAEVIEQPSANQNEPRELGWDDVQPVDMIGLEVGYRIIPLVDKNQNGQLLQRIKGVRRKISTDLGFLVPTVHIRDNLDLMPNTYRITLMGVTIATSEIYPERDLAIDPGQVLGKVNGLETKDPAFGLDAVWIEPTQKDQAQALGYTVVDASTVIATHINQIIYDHASELLGHEELQKLLDNLSKISPSLVENLVPNTISQSVLLKILQNLLTEKIPIRDIRTIAEAVAEQANKSKDIDQMTAAARESLGRLIVHTIIGDAAELPAMTLHPNLEQLLLRSVQQAKQMGGTDSDAVIEPGLADQIQKLIQESKEKMEVDGHAAVLLVAQGIRSMLARFLRYSMPALHVLAYNEIPSNKNITVVSTIEQ